MNIVYNECMDKLRNMFKGKRTVGIVGAIIAVATIVSSVSTLKSYMETKKKKK